MSDLQKNQQSLIYSEKMASVGLLAAGFAHEINNPLAYSLSNLYTLIEYVNDISSAQQQLISDTNIPDSAKEPIMNEQYTSMLEDMEYLANDTRHGLLSAKEIASDLCGYVYAEKKHFSSIDINHGIRTTLRILRNKIKNNCDIKVELNEIPEIYGSAGKINQVVMNIILNAIQANKKACLINIHTSTDGSNININISDNGPGIPKENINDIFTPFYTTKPIGEGTGLGLFVCYKIITEEHLGIISVDSTKKRTTFKITLPLPKVNHQSLV